MKKLLLMLVVCTFCKAENTIFYAQRHPYDSPSMKEILDEMEVREKAIIAECLAYIKNYGKEDGIILARIALAYEMDNNPHNTVFSIKRCLNEMGYNV